MDKLMICPKCKLEQPKDMYCAGCGVHVQNLQKKPLEKLKSHHFILVSLLLGGFIALSYILLSPNHQSSQSKFRKQVKTNWKTVSTPVRNIKMKKIKESPQQKDVYEAPPSTEKQELLNSKVTEKKNIKEKASSHISPPVTSSSKFFAHIKLLEVSHEALVDVLAHHLNLSVEEEKTSLEGRLFVFSSRSLFNTPQEGVSSFYEKTQELKLSQTINLSNGTLFIKVKTITSKNITLSFSYEPEGEVFESTTINPGNSLLMPFVNISEDENQPKWAVVLLSLKV